MPSVAVSVYVTHWTGQPGQGLADYGGYEGPYDIAVTGVEWSGINKPKWLRDALDSGWLNWTRGEWVHWSIVVIPPFTFEPGRWVEKAIDVALNALDAIVNWSKAEWDKQWEQNIGFAGLIRGLGGEISDLRNLFGDIGAFFERIFTRVMEEIVKVEPFKTIINVVNTLLDFLPEDWAELKNLLFNPIDYFLDRLDEYLYDEGE